MIIQQFFKAYDYFFEKNNTIMPFSQHYDARCYSLSRGFQPYDANNLAYSVTCATAALKPIGDTFVRTLEVKTNHGKRELIKETKEARDYIETLQKSIAKEHSYIPTGRSLLEGVDKLDFLEEFLGKMKLSTLSVLKVREERKQILTTK
jgi:hypothetical protein